MLVKIRGESPFADFAASGLPGWRERTGQDTEAILDDWKRRRDHFSATSTLSWAGLEKGKREERFSGIFPEEFERWCVSTLFEPGSIMANTLAWSSRKRERESCLVPRKMVAAPPLVER